MTLLLLLPINPYSIIASDDDPMHDFNNIFLTFSEIYRLAVHKLRHITSSMQQDISRLTDHKIRHIKSSSEIHRLIVHKIRHHTTEVEHDMLKQHLIATYSAVLCFTLVWITCIISYNLYFIV